MAIWDAICYRLPIQETYIFSLSRRLLFKCFPLQLFADIILGRF